MAYKHTDKIELDSEYQNIETYKRLCESQEKEKILTMKVVGCLPNKEGTKASQKYFAIGYYDGYQILIPGTLLGLGIEGAKDKAGNPVTESQKTNMYKAYIKAMIGAEIDFVVYKDPGAINTVTQMAIGDRSRAMEKKRESNFFKQDKDGKSKVERAFEANEALLARVVSIAQSVVFVEIYGFVTAVIAREVSWRYTEDLRDVVHIGEQIHVKFKNLEIDRENKTINGTVSIKDAQPNVMRENMKKYRPESVLLGKISGARDGAYFVQIGDHRTGIDVYCKKVNCIDTPHVGDTVSVKLFIFDDENARVFGSIENIIERKYQNFAA